MDTLNSLRTVLPGGFQRNAMQHQLKRTSARWISLAICLVLSAGLFVLSGSILPDSATVTIRLIDSETERPLAGVIQIVLPDGKRRRQPDLVRELLAEIVANRKTGDEQSKFADEQERARVLDVYDAAIEKLQMQLNSL